MKKYKKIIDETLKNGGYTATKSKKNRYIVAIAGYEKTLKIEDFTEKQIADYIAKNGDEVGTWINGGKVYLDRVESYSDKKQAIAIATERKEKAIFDLETLSEIFI